MNAIVNITNLLKSAKEFFPFHGGVHPPENKSQSTQLPIAKLAMPAKLVLPLRQHVGNMPKLKVSVGEQVLKGQLLAEADGNVSAAIHAPTSGVITAIEDAIIPHPSGLPDRCIILTPDHQDTWIEKSPTDWRNTERAELVKKLRTSGIVGLGGATFPTHIKLNAQGKSGVHTLVINAAECEPYISCDDMLMRERADEVIKGIAIAQHLLGASHVLIGIEDNKPEATAAMQAAVLAANTPSMQVKTVPTLYPSGDARRLIYLLLGLEIPSDKRSTDLGIQVFNVATVLALHRYFDFGEPSLSRIVSMTGDVTQPQNFEILFGTPVGDLVKAAGGAKDSVNRYIMGGPMMGFDLPAFNRENMAVPLTKAANCIIAASPALFAEPPPAMPCIRCARCADACPVSLQPQELYWFAKGNEFEKAREYKLFDCIECGACSYVCPSNIPLVQYYRFGKSEIIALDRAKEAADIARERNDFKLERIEREKTERAERNAAKGLAAKEAAAKKEAAALNTADTAPADVVAEAKLAVAPAIEDKKAAIAAAIERAKALKAAQSDAPKNVAEVTSAVEAEIKAIDARREAAAEKAATIGVIVPTAAKLGDVALADIAPQTTAQADMEAEAKQAKIAAAIERAKAAKAAKLAANQQAESVLNIDKAAKVDDEKAVEVMAESTVKVAAPVVSDASSAVSSLASTVEQEQLDKQAKIAAAIERAKAAKAAKLAADA